MNHRQIDTLLETSSYRGTFNQPNRLPSAKFLVCFKFHSASMSLKVCENVFRVSNSLDLDETPSYISFGSNMFAYMVLWL